jgi:hypothetical protein
MAKPVRASSGKPMNFSTGDKNPFGYAALLKPIRRSGLSTGGFQGCHAKILL